MTKKPETMIFTDRRDFLIEATASAAKPFRVGAYFVLAGTAHQARAAVAARAFPDVTRIGKEYLQQLMASELREPTAEPTDAEVGALADIDASYAEFWAPVVENNGVLDVHQVKKELCDYRYILESVPKVYDHVTGGNVTKANTDPETVCSLADDYYSEGESDEDKNQVIANLLDVMEAWGAQEDGIPENAIKDYSAGCKAIGRNTEISDL